MNLITKTEIKTSIKSDPSTVSINLDINKIKRGPGIFKLNNSLLLEEEYKHKIQKAIKDIQELNKDANPVILWSIVKGTIRNETISYSCRKKKKQHA